MIIPDHSTVNGLAYAALIILLRRQGGEMIISHTEYEEAWGSTVSHEALADGKIRVKVSANCGRGRT